MFDTIDPVLLLAGGLIVLSLLGYLGWLLLQLKWQQRRHAAVQTQLDDSNQAQHEQRRKSIELIALAAIDGDCELSEACIRIKHLLDYYPGLAAEPEHRVIGEMYAEISGFATHDARQALTVSERSAEDRARYRIEERYGNAFMACMQTLHARMRALEGSRYDFDTG